MPRQTPGFTKNMIRRSLREILDPSPTRSEINQIWDHFDSMCAYCQKRLKRGKKGAHIDHLVSAARGGSNHVSNRVLSCAQCNEKEKLDAPWDEFLKKKVLDSASLKTRRGLIIAWQKHAHKREVRLDPKMLKRLQTASEEVVEYYDRAVSRMRTAARRAKNTRK